MNTPELSRAVWRKSSHSTENGGACVEVAVTPDGGRRVRDSKDRTRPAHYSLAPSGTHSSAA